MLRDKEQLRAALRVALIKDRRDEEVFDEIFDQFFALVKVGGPDVGHGHGHGHDDLSDEGALEDFTLCDTPSDTPQQGHTHGKPVDIRDFFKPEDLAQQYNLHQEANKIDLAAMTDEIVLSKDNQGIAAARATGCRSRPTACTTRACRARSRQQQGTKVDADLSVAQQEALLGWLNDVDGGVAGRHRGRRRRAAPAAHRRARRAARGVEEAPRGADGAGEPGRRGRTSGAVAEVDRVGEHERMELEESLRRLARSLHGGLTHKRKVSARGRIDSGPHDAPQHALRRHPVRARSRSRARRGQAAAGDPRRRVAVRAGHRPVHPAPRARAAEPVRAGPRRSRSSPSWSRSPTCSPTTPSSRRWG